MSRETTSNQDGEPATCLRADCSRDVDFWVYHADEGRWRRLCRHHTLHLHPSIEVNTWLESGYARPVELGRPTGPPTPPPEGRPAAFREVVDRAMDWT